MNKLEIKVPTSWQDVNIRKFEKLQEINNNDESADFKIVSVLCDLDIDVVESLPMNTFSEILNKLKFLSELPKPHKPAKQLIVNEQIVNCCLSSQEMIAAQFFDYKNYLSNDVDKKTARLLSCFMTPDGYEYNDGYDSEEWIDFLNENISVVEVQSYTNFFTLTFKSFAAAILQYSIRQVKKMKLSKEEKEMMLIPLQQTMDIIKSGGFLQ